MMRLTGDGKMIRFLLAGMMATGFLNAADPEWDAFKAKTLVHQHEAQGWCTKEKAEKMMDLIYEVQPSVCVEIGVFGGSSIYPTAKALKYLGGGVVYAIDPWAKEDCQEGYDPNDPNYIWWSSINLDDIYKGFLYLLKKHRLEDFCEPLRMTSEEALSFFEDGSIDILHVDGNHTSEVALSDAEMWFPKVVSGGYIWFDDVNWASTAKAVTYLREKCEVDYSRSVGRECLLFKKP